MNRRKILEKHWKSFRLGTGLKYEPMSDKAYESMEMAMEEYTKLRLANVVGRSEQFYCDERDKYGNTDCTQQCMACVRDEQAKQ